MGSSPHCSETYSQSPAEWLVAVHDLRREVESSPLPTLPRLGREAMGLSDRICWAALEQGDVDGFWRYAETAVALREFTANAGLLP